MLCGVDEAGRGPVIGPLVVAAVAIGDESALAGMKVRDSKKLSGRQREALAPQIRAVARVETVFVEAGQIDALREELTMNEIEERAFASLLDRIKAEDIFLDAADVRAEEFGRQVCSFLSYKPRKVVSEHKADATYPVVSAASIIAKTERDAAVRRIAVELGERIGSGYPSDPMTIGFLERYAARHRRMPPHTRNSWETAREILARQRIKKLEDITDDDGRA